jgi:hypothetical protein
VVVDDETRTAHAGVATAARREAQDFAVEIERFVKICAIDADVGDAGDGRARGLVLRFKWDCKQSESYHRKGATHQITSGFRYRFGF